VEGQYKAIELGEVKKNGNYYQQIFLNRVARGLLELGYPLRRTTRDFELEYISDETICKYSRRTSQIEDRIKEKGITNAKLKSMQGAETRNRKKYDLSKAEVEDYWQSRLDGNTKDLYNSGKNTEKSEVQQAKSTSFLQNFNPFNKKILESEQAKPEQKLTPSFDKSYLSQIRDKAIKYSLDKNFERLTVQSHKQLVIDSLKYGIESGLTYSDVRDSFLDLERHNQLVSKPDKDHLYSRFSYTKQAYLDQEKEIVQIIENGKFTSKSINSDFEPKNKILSQEQKDAVIGILSSKDQVIILAGRAGTGKTTTLKEVQYGAVKNGIQVLALAATTSAKDVLTQEGFFQ
jgi:primosomal protein N'